MGFGTKGWIGLVAYITAFDLYAIYTDKETLSGAFYKAVQHPRQRWLVIVLWLYTTGHLFNILGRWDILRRINLPFR